MNALRHNRRSIRELLIGDSVSIGSQQYRVQRIASGGMGVVLLLELEVPSERRGFSVHGMRVAIKSVHPELVDEQSRELFRRELTIWAGFRHPNVVAVNEILDAGQDGWAAAMPYCEGSLRDALRSVTKLSVEQATMILCDVIKGLAYAQSNGGVLHLDIKPENVLYTLDLKRLLRYPADDLRRNRFMISDWGIASIKQRKVRASATAVSAPEASARTFNNMGTILYMAPERFIEGYRSSIASDMFSLGMMYFEMLTGVLPFRPDEDPIQVLLSHAYFRRAAEMIGKADDLTSSNSGTKMLSLLSLGLLSPAPKKRPDSYEDLISMLWTSYKLETDTFTPESELHDPFDPLPAPNSAEEEFERFMRLPSQRRTELRLLREYVEKQVANLKAVGRESEATNLIDNYILQLFQEWEDEPDNPYCLVQVASAAIKFGDLERGKTLLECAISRAQAETIPIDLTNIYFHLGRLHHYLRRDPSDELWCYEMAIQSQAPSGCRFPASSLQKIRAYLFACNEAAVKAKRKHEKWYNKRLHELAPSVSWEEPEDITRFLITVSDSENEQAESNSALNSRSK